MAQISNIETQSRLDPFKRFGQRLLKIDQIGVLGALFML